MAGTPPGHAHSPALSQVSVPTASPYRYPKGWEAGAGVSLSSSLPSSSLSIHIHSIFLYLLFKCTHAGGDYPVYVPRLAPLGTPLAWPHTACVLDVFFLGALHCNPALARTHLIMRFNQRSLRVGTAQEPTTFVASPSEWDNRHL